MDICLIRLSHASFCHISLFKFLSKCLKGNSMIKNCNAQKQWRNGCCTNFDPFSRTGGWNKPVSTFYRVGLWAGSHHQTHDSLEAGQALIELSKFLFSRLAHFKLVGGIVDQRILCRLIVQANYFWLFVTTSNNSELNCWFKFGLGSYQKKIICHIIWNIYN